MHSHDRTLLAKLGFADPDRKDPLHDLASQYLALPANAERIRRMCGWEDPYWHETPPRLEHIITKGDGRFQTTVGFADLFLAPVIVEVKIGRCTAGDLTRQLALYAQHAHDECGRDVAANRGQHLMAAAVAFEVSPSFAAALESARIKLVRLGPKFHEWAKEQQSAASATVEEL